MSSILAIRTPNAKGRTPYGLQASGSAASICA